MISLKEYIASLTPEEQKKLKAETAKLRKELKKEKQ